MVLFFMNISLVRPVLTSVVAHRTSIPCLQVAPPLSFASVG